MKNISAICAFFCLAFFTSNVSLSEVPHSDSKIDVGLILPLSGPLAEYGTAFQNGVDLAKKHSPNIMQHCEFHAEDSKYDSKIAVSGFNKLSKITKAPIIYNWGGPTSEAVAPLADPQDVVLFVWSADPRVAQQRKNVVRFCNSGREYAEVLTGYLKEQNYKKIGIVKTENQYIDSILDGLVDTAGDHLNIDVIDNYLPSDQDFRSSISKIKNQKYDALGLFLLSGQVSNFARRLKEQAISVPLFGTDFFESLTEVKQAQGGLKDAIFSNNEVSPDFRKTYVQKYGNDLQINHAANGYDFATLLCSRILPDMDTFSSDTILKHVADVSSYSGEQGHTKFTSNSESDKSFPFPVVVRKVKDEIIETIDAG